MFFLSIKPFLLLFIAIFIIFIIYILLKPTIKGYIGEFKVNYFLKRLIKDEGFLVKNLIINYEELHSQIDHILISRRGVFVIETKNYSGMIFGDDNNKNWTQTLMYGKVKNSFYSPVKQNFSHIYSLEKLFKNEGINFINTIIFVGGDIKNVKSKFVFDRISFKKFYKNCNIIYSQKEIEYIYRKIANYKNMNDFSLKDHVNHINENKKLIENNICPYCKRELILKKGKYGEFYSCVNFPKCKFRKKK